MRHAAFLPIATIVAALTAVALVGTALALRPPELPARSPGLAEAATRELALAFYDAANAAIADGDLTALEQFAAPALLARADGSQLGARPASVADRLLALHATAPALRLRPEVLAVDGDLVVVGVGVAHGAIPSFLGLNLVEHPSAWGPVDVLRVADRRIVEYRGGSANAGVLEPALAARFDASPAVHRVAVAQRITLAAGSRHAVGITDGPRLLYVEVGTVAVEVIPTASLATSDATLTAGEHLILRPGANYTIHNAAPTPATLVDVSTAGTAQPLHTPGTATPLLEDGVVQRVLAGGVTAALPIGPLVLAIGRATLEPGARLAWTEAAGSVLLHVEEGAAHFDPRAGVVWIRDGTSGRRDTLGDDPLAAGIGVQILAGNGAEFRAGPDAPTTVLIVSLLPAS